jgi:hypothetical protein
MMLHPKTENCQHRMLDFAEVFIIDDAPPALFDGIEVVCGAISIRLPKSTAPKRIADIAHGFRWQRMARRA